jgi:hypothetical protein
MKIIMRAIIITFVLMCGIAKAKADNTYTINATVINADNDVVTCEDVNGNVWEFYGDGFKVNDAIVLIMNSNHTTTIYDDMIEDVQK